LVDLIVEDRVAEQIDRVRARKEGGPGWNTVEQRHFVKTFPGEEEGEVVKQGFNPDEPEPESEALSHALDTPFAVGDDDEGDGEGKKDGLGGNQPWEDKTYATDSEGQAVGADKTVFDEERDAWGR
ncbi:hypothetical protein LTR53_015320, partial [Teratosphaeriaceae sp. CCFEE 6253]